MSNIVKLEARKYDAASQAPRLKDWMAPGTDGTAAIIGNNIIRNRARDLIRNNPWAQKGIQAIVNNSVGTGIKAQIAGKNKGRAAKVEEIWNKWALTSQCDADGHHNLFGLQRLAFRCMVESGECIIRLRPRRVEDGLAVPFQIQVIEPDQIAETYRLTPNPGKYIYHGIEYDEIGRRTAYYLYHMHPGRDLIQYQQLKISKVPAEEIIHLYRKDRAGQERGVSWFAPVMVRLRDLSLYEDAVLRRAQISNLFAGFVRSDNPEDASQEFNGLPSLEPGAIYALKPGTDITFSSPPSTADDPAYRDSCLRAIASGLGISFEALTGNLSEVNFSSARLGSHEMFRNIDAWLYSSFIPKVCDGIWGWFCNVMNMSGQSTDGVTVTWTPPARTIVDPTKEMDALLVAVKSGFKSLPEAIREQGYDPDILLEEQKEYLMKLDAAGVMVESDFRQQIVAKAQADTKGDKNAGQDSVSGNGSGKPARAGNKKV